MHMSRAAPGDRPAPTCSIQDGSAGQTRRASSSPAGSPSARLQDNGRRELDQGEARYSPGSGMAVRTPRGTGSTAPWGRWHLSPSLGSSQGAVAGPAQRQAPPPPDPRQSPALRRDLPPPEGQAPPQASAPKAPPRS